MLFPLSVDFFASVMPTRKNRHLEGRKYPTVPTNVTSIEGTLRFAPRALNSFQSHAHGNLLDTARNINLFFSLLPSLTLITFSSADSDS